MIDIRDHGGNYSGGGGTKRPFFKLKDTNCTPMYMIDHVTFLSKSYFRSSEVMYVFKDRDLCLIRDADYSSANVIFHIVNYKTGDKIMSTSSMNSSVYAGFSTPNLSSGVVAKCVERGNKLHIITEYVMILFVMTIDLDTNMITIKSLDTRLLYTQVTNSRVHFTIREEYDDILIYDGYGRYSLCSISLTKVLDEYASGTYIAPTERIWNISVTGLVSGVEQFVKMSGDYYIGAGFVYQISQDGTTFARITTTVLTGALIKDKRFFFTLEVITKAGYVSFKVNKYQLNGTFISSLIVEERVKGPQTGVPSYLVQPCPRSFENKVIVSDGHFVHIIGIDTFIVENKMLFFGNFATTSGFYYAQDDILNVGGITYQATTYILMET